MFRRYESRVDGFTCDCIAGSHCSSTHIAKLARDGTVYAPEFRSETMRARSASASFRVRKLSCHFWMRRLASLCPTSTPTYQRVWSLPDLSRRTRLWMCPCIAQPPPLSRERAEPFEQRGNGHEQVPPKAPGGDLASPGRFVCGAPPEAE